MAWKPATAAVSADVSRSPHLPALPLALTIAVLTVGHADRAADEQTFPVAEEMVLSSFANHFGEPEDDLGCHLGFGKERSKASWRSARGETCFTYLVSYSTATEIRYRGGMLGQGGVQGEDGELREDTLLQRRGAEQVCPSSDHERED